MIKENRECSKSSQADSFIEECFEQKCFEQKDYNHVINQWRKDKEEYISYTSITGFDFQHYSMHDESHSIAILRNIEMVLGRDRVMELEAGDLWLLLECAYSHDVGMSLTYEDLCKVWDSEEFTDFLKKNLLSGTSDIKRAEFFYAKMDYELRKKESFIAAAKVSLDDLEEEFQDDYEDLFKKSCWPVICERYITLIYTEYIRKKHPERSKEFIKKYLNQENINIPSRMYESVASCAYLHGLDFGEIFTQAMPTENAFWGKLMYPQFAAAMLRLGDLLDMDTNRFNIRMTKHMGMIPLESMLHMKKHKAVTHLSFTEERIQAEVRSEDFQVCKVANQWFQMLDQEVKDLISCWNRIAPPALRGCRMNRADLKIYLNGKLFDARKQNVVVANPENVYNMLIGNNIYKSRLDFLREYLQNAMDASKISLWLKLKEDKVLWKRLDTDTISPFDIDRRMLEDLKISIHASLDKKENIVVLSVRDRGIGMEKKCIDAIARIASNSWNERESYLEEVSRMPLWMRPTGGFGIGIQSAFMFTDAVEFITCARGENTGWKIKMESVRKGGHISVSEDRSIRKGTRVTVRIRWTDFLYEIMKDKERYLEGIEGNIYDDDDIPRIIVNVLYQYVSRNAAYSMFPIEVSCENEPAQIWQGRGLYKNSSNPFLPIEKMTVSGFEYELKFWADEKCVFLWDLKKQQMIVCELSQESGKERTDKCYFKGIRIGNEKLKTMEDYQLHIIYYGGDVSRYLKISRDEFCLDKKRMFAKDVEEYRLLFAVLLSQKYAEFENTNVGESMRFSELVYYGLGKVEIPDLGLLERMLELGKNLQVRYLDMDFMRKIDRLEKNCKSLEIEQKDAASVFQAARRGGLLKEKTITSREMVEYLTSHQEIFYAAERDMNDPSQYPIRTMVEEIRKIMELREKGSLPEATMKDAERWICYNLTQEGTLIFTDDRLRRILDAETKGNAPHMNVMESDRFIIGIKTYQKDDGKRADRGICVTKNLLQACLKDMWTSFEVSDRKLPYIIKAMHVEKGKDGFRLWVDSAYDENYYDTFSNAENDGMEYKYLLLPIRKTVWYWLKAELKHSRSITKAKYDAITKRREDYNHYIDWVYKHQLNEEPLGKDEIWKEYERILDLIYEILE